MLQVKEYYWKRSVFVELYGKLYIPDGQMKALIIMVHGLGEYSGCYDDRAEKFAAQFVGFFIFDLRGNGHSSGKRGHASFKTIKDDLRFIIKIMQQKFPSVPIVLYGHSMGGSIVLSYVVEENAGLQGVIASSPWVKLVRSLFPPLVCLVKWASYVVPWLTVSTGIRADQLSHGDIGTKSAKKDPLLHKKISVKLFTDLWNNGKMMLRNKHKLNIPLLLMHGTDDPVTSHQASKSFAQNVEGNVTFKKWHRMRHDLLKDDGNEVVFQYVMKWLSKQIIKNGTVQDNSKLYRIS